MNTDKYDYILFLLMGGMIFSVITLFVAEIWFATDAPLFTFLTSLGTGFSASFFTRLTAKSQPAPPGATVDTATTTKMHQEPSKDVNEPPAKPGA